MANFKAQAERFGALIIERDATRVDFSQRPFRIWTSEDELTADAVVVATGASALWLGLESEEAFRGRGVSACATCDGALPRFRNKPLVVVGGGDTAMEEALFLTKFASKVHVVHRRDKFRASKIMGDRVINHEKVQVEHDRRRGAGE
jgi:thioredoxin reductase (NADPH)